MTYILWAVAIIGALIVLGGMCWVFIYVYEMLIDEIRDKIEDIKYRKLQRQRRKNTKEVMRNALAHERR